jgi:hypothetical protein
MFVNSKQQSFKENLIIIYKIIVITIKIKNEKFIKSKKYLFIIILKTIKWEI